MRELRPPPELPPSPASRPARPPSRARYLFGQVVPLAIVANVVVNWWGAHAFYPAGLSVPLTGDRSAGGDTLVGAFLIGFFTFLLGAPAARREARAGRVPGFGRKVPLGEWSARHPLLAALGFAVGSLLALGVPAVIGLGALAGDALPYGAFVAWKVAFSAAAGVATGIVTALYAIAPADPSLCDDPRWCRDPERPTGGAVYPCDYIDRGGLAVTSRAHGCSGTPTWQLRVRGVITPEALERAVGWLLARYPSLGTRVQSLDGVPELATRFRYAHDPACSAARLVEAHDLRGAPERLAALEQELLDRHVDLFTDFPLTVALVRTGEDACRLYVRQHHAIADGRAFIELLADFAGFLEAARAGRVPEPSALAPIHRRGELEPLGLPKGREAAFTVAGTFALLGAIAGAARAPLVPLAQNRSNDYTGENGTVHVQLPDERLETWNRLRKPLGVSLNSLLTAALFEATRRWHRERNLPLGRTNCSMMMDTRPRDGSFRSFANHLTILEVTARLDGDQPLPELARRLHAQVEAQRRSERPTKRLLAERRLSSLLALDQLQRIVFESKRPTHCLNFSNLIPLPFPTLAGDGWAVEDVLITTPVTPRVGLVLTVIRYGGRLTFNFNYKSSAFSRADTEALARTFCAVLDQMATGFPDAGKRVTMA